MEDLQAKIISFKNLSVSKYQKFRSFFVSSKYANIALIGLILFTIPVTIFAAQYIQELAQRSSLNLSESLSGTLSGPISEPISNPLPTTIPTTINTPTPLIPTATPIPTVTPIPTATKIPTPTPTTIPVDATPPVITLISPTSATLSTPTTIINMFARDASGISVIYIETRKSSVPSTPFQKVKTCPNTTTCSYSWSTTSLPAGTYEFKITAVDNAIPVHNKSVLLRSIKK